MGDLDGRIVLVTGGARGIGRVTARLCAESGADVAVLDRDPADATLADIRACGRRTAARRTDVGDAAALRVAVEALAADLGAPQVLVNNAAITNHIAAVERMDRVRWDHEVAVNLSAAFTAVQCVLPAMRERGFGRIVFVSSGAATGGLPLQAAYAASKAGLLGLMRTIAVEYGPYGITCNAVLPGLIETEVVAAMPAPLKAAVVARTPAGRLGRMEEVAAVIRFLATDLAGYVNGAEVAIDGGGQLNTASLGSLK